MKQFVFRNEKMSCAGKTFQKLDLSHWKHDSSQILMDASILRAAVVQAQEDIKQIYAEENAQYREVNPRSPVGTAFKFNRPKRQATLIANTSLVLQLASARILDDYIQR